MRPCANMDGAMFDLLLKKGAAVNEADIVS